MIQAMRNASLEVTYRAGRAWAAYLRLPREQASRVDSSEPIGGGLVVDYDDAGSVVGIEITSPELLDWSELSRLLDRLGIDREVVEAELKPLRRAG